MKLYDTLSDMLAEARRRDRHIRFIDGQHDESVLPFAELWERAVALLGSLQSRGMKPGDELIIPLQQFDRLAGAAGHGGGQGVREELRAREFREGHEEPAEGIYTKYFYKGYMEYFKISRAYNFARISHQHSTTACILLPEKALLLHYSKLCYNFCYGSHIIQLCSEPHLVVNPFLKAIYGAS